MLQITQKTPLRLKGGRYENGYLLKRLPKGRYAPVVIVDAKDRDLWHCYVAGRIEHVPEHVLSLYAPKACASVMRALSVAEFLHKIGATK